MAGSSLVKRGTWILVTTVGLAGGIFAGVLLGIPLGRIANAMIVTVALTGATGAALGGMQAAVIRPLLPRPIWWIVATTAGVGAGLAAGIVVIEKVGTFFTGHRPSLFQVSPLFRALSFVMLGIIAGTILGLLQGLVFRLQRFPIKFWAATTGIALGGAFAAGSILVDVSGLKLSSLAGFIAFVLASGLAFGTLTSWPLLRPRPN